MANYMVSSFACCMGGILTGVILAISRAVGETAPLIVVGALAYVPFTPKGQSWMNLPLCQFKFLTGFLVHNMNLQ